MFYNWSYSQSLRLGPKWPVLRPCSSQDGRRERFWLTDSRLRELTKERKKIIDILKTYTVKTVHLYGVYSHNYGINEELLCVLDIWIFGLIIWNQCLAIYPPLSHLWSWVCKSYRTSRRVHPATTWPSTMPCPWWVSFFGQLTCTPTIWWVLFWTEAALNEDSTGPSVGDTVSNHQNRMSKP